MKILISKRFLSGITKVPRLTVKKVWPDISQGFMEDYKAIKGDWEKVGKEIREAGNGLSD